MKHATIRRQNAALSAAEGLAGIENKNVWYNVVVVTRPIEIQSAAVRYCSAEYLEPALVVDIVNDAVLGVYPVVGTQIWMPADALATALDDG